MIEIFQATNTEVLQFLADKIKPVAGYDPEYSLMRMKAMMQNTPDRIFMGVIFDNITLVGFLVAWLVTDHPWCWVEHAWASNKLDKKYVEQMWKMVQEWARARECTELRIETSRVAEAYTRKYGFEVVTTIMRKEL